MIDDVKETMVEGYLEDNDKSIEDLRHEADHDLRKWLKGTGYSIPLTCEECSNRLLYSEDREKYFCPFCE